MSECKKSDSIFPPAQVIIDHEDFTDFTPFPEEGNTSPIFTYIKVASHVINMLIFSHVSHIQPAETQKFVIVLDVSGSMTQGNNPRLPRSIILIF